MESLRKAQTTGHHKPTNYWQGKMWILVKESGKRKKQELEEEAEEVNALAMLSSPLQSLSPPPSNDSVPEVAQNPKTNTAISDESPEISTRPSDVQAGPSQRPLQPTPEHESDYLSTLTKGQKRTRTEVEGHEEEGLDQTSRTTRQRRYLATLQPKQEPAPTTKSTKAQKGNCQRFPEPRQWRDRNEMSCHQRLRWLSTRCRGSYDQEVQLHIARPTPR